MPGKPVRFLPTTQDEMRALDWAQLDVLLITGDPYFDHPSHGTALIGRVLEQAGYRTGILPHPDWSSPADFTRMGRPALFVGITAGAVDSMLNNYTAQRHRRKGDAYATGTDAEQRPNFATLVYAQRAREAFPGLPIVLGGIEASTRRFTYFDYIKGQLRRSLLVDTRADLLVFGAGETQVLEIAKRLSQGRDLRGIPGTARLLKRGETPHGVALPDHDAICQTPALLVTQTQQIETHSGPGRPTAFFQRYAEGAVQCEPRAEISDAQWEALTPPYFSRDAHPAYPKDPAALETVRWSVIATRGCPGGCSFCAIAMHQGRRVNSRSEEAIAAEVQQLSAHPRFRGTVTDVGGPTANAWGTAINDLARCQTCARASCYFPRICSNLRTPQHDFVQMLGRLKQLPRIRHLFIASGIRHDLALQSPPFIDALAQHHTGGHLKVAPEHVHPEVLRRMRKPSIAAFEDFEAAFLRASKAAHRQQYIVPYFIAGFPGCTPAMGNSAAHWLAQRGQRLQQMQIFIPLPGTMAAAMYAAKMDADGAPLYIPPDAERRRQKKILTGATAPQRRTQQPRRTARRRVPNSTRSKAK
ncbi:MAG: YgiQ family radical SAM protein [Proteobacteria bacterium]|nr:YgiQ family radical SAM protein [Pseudomonadota bacterium]